MNLFTDHGPGYYANSLSGLKAAISAHRTHRPDVSPAGLDGIARTADRSPAAARHAVLATIGGGPKWTPAERRARATMRQAYLHGPRRYRRYTPPTPRQVDDSYVWMLSEEALEQGAGRPRVRAAALEALSTIQGVRQAPTTVDGRPALRVGWGTGRDLERVWLQAGTGVPIREVDGRDFDVLTFHVRRVTLSQLMSPTR